MQCKLKGNTFFFSTEAGITGNCQLKKNERSTDLEQFCYNLQLVFNMFKIERDLHICSIPEYVLKQFELS